MRGDFGRSTCSVSKFIKVLVGLVRYQHSRCQVPASSLLRITRLTRTRNFATIGYLTVVMFVRMSSLWLEVIPGSTTLAIVDDSGTWCIWCVALPSCSVNSVLTIIVTDTAGFGSLSHHCFRYNLESVTRVVPATNSLLHASVAARGGFMSHQAIRVPLSCCDCFSQAICKRDKAA